MITESAVSEMVPAAGVATVAQCAQEAAAVAAAASMEEVDGGHRVVIEEVQRRQRGR